jgi:hypothetical protein
VPGRTVRPYTSIRLSDELILYPCSVVSLVAQPYSVFASGPPSVALQAKKQAGISWMRGTKFGMGSITVQITKKSLAATLVILSLLILTTPNAMLAAGRALPCVVSSGKWVDLPLFQSETGIFRIAYNATPSNSAVDGVTGLASSPASAYTSLAAIVRFNSTGTIDAMSGSNYTAATTIPYAANVTYHFIMDVNMATHTYSAYVMLDCHGHEPGLSQRASDSDVAGLSWSDDDAGE